MIRATGNHVFIRKAPESVSRGGIVLPEQEYDEGVIAAVGPGKFDKKGRRESMWDLKAGQRVSFSPNGNQRTTVDGEEFIVVRRDAIIGLVVP